MEFDMDRIEQQIVQYVDEHKEEYIRFLGDLVKINSITGYEKKAQEFVRKKMEEFGAETEFLEPDLKKMFEKFPEVAQVPSIGEEGLDMPLMTDDKFTYEQIMASTYDRLKSYKDRPNLIGRIKGTGGGKSLILNGHIDTVPVGDASKWKHDPFGAEIEDGKMYGRGTVDMKGGIATMVFAVEVLQKLGIKLKGDLMMQSVVNEEHAGGGALGAVTAGLTADAAIVVEPSGNSQTIQDGSCGGVYWQVVIKGREAHAGARWKDGEHYGVSANEKSACIITSLLKMEREVNKDETLMSFCIGKLHGGTYATASAPECVMNGVAYFFPKLGTGPAGINKVKKLIRDAVMNVDDPWLKANPPELKFQHYDDAYKLDGSKDAILKEVAGCIKDVLGKEPGVTVAGGGGDARHLGNQGGIPAIYYGPGSAVMAHSTDEYIELDDYIKGIKVLAVAVYRWCNGV